MIWATGERVLAGSGDDPFPGSHVFLASAALGVAEQLEQIAVRLAGRSGLAWLAEGSPPAITVLPHDGTSVLEDTALPGGLALSAGTPIELGDEALVVGGARIALAGAGAGVVSFAGELDPWIRYFFATGAGTPPPLAGVRFRLFDAPRRAEVVVDPSRPFDPERTNAAPAAEPVRSTLRTRWAGALTIAPRPPDSRYVLEYDPERREAYWTLDGEWTWAAGGAEEIELLLGLSGAEYARAPAAFTLRFVAAGPAFAPGFSPHLAPAGADQFPLQPSIPGVSEAVRTAWIYTMPPLGAPGTAQYYSQPDIAGLFRAQLGDPFLHSLPVAAAPLPPGGKTPYAPHPSFPAAPWAGLEPGTIDDAALTRFEIEVLGAARAQVIYGLEPGGPGEADGPRGLASSPEPPPAAAPGATAPTGPTGPVTTAVTPQGLLSTLSPDLTAWRSLVLAQSGGGAQRLALTDVSGALREALLANRLFLVVSDVDALRRYCSTTFEVTNEVLRLAVSEQIPAPAIQAVARLRGRVYESLAYFDPALDQVLGTTYPDAKKFFVKHSERAQVTIGDWRFDLAAWRWPDPDDDSPTMMIVKLVEGTLGSLIGDLSRWTLPAEFNAGDGSGAQQRLLGIAARARAALPNEPDLRYFVDTVLGDAGSEEWNGVLFLNPVVPTDELPDDLRALAGGLPSGEVRAHHLGVTLSSFELSGTAVDLDDSAMFALILYSDETDLVYTGSAYDFKVLSLKVLFANSTISSFSSQVELLVGQLFNELSTLQGSLRGDNVLLDGTLDHGAYRFTSTALNHFTVASQVVDFVDIARAELVTVNAESTATRTVARFIFEGRLGFRSLSAADLFGYGPAGPDDDSGLSYAGLMVSMEFDPNDPKATRTLSFVAGQTTFDISGSAARPGSLARRFPLSPAALHQSERAAATRPATPADLGFIPVESPVPMGALGDVWFGLELTLSFGSPGALAPTLGFTGALLLSWAPSADQPNVAVGLRLPGSSGSSRALTIMGPLKLDIGALDLMHDESGYLLRLANVALAFMGLRFPSGGRANALLFGNPDPGADTAALGWYAAYAKDPEKER